jgi:predicted peroxiredoxin
MVDTIKISKDGTINSYLSSLVVAMNSKKKGIDVSVVFMQEGLAALIGKKFRFSRGLESYSENIKDNAAMMGVPSDPFKLIEHAKSMGIPLYACQAWMKLLGGRPPRFTIPEGLEKLELSDLIEILDNANKVITL